MVNNYSNKFKNWGLTLVELVLVIGLFLAIFSFMGITLEDFRKKSILENSTNEVYGLITRAQSKTIAGVNGKAYKIKFYSDKLELQSEDSIVDEKLILNSMTEIVLPMSDITFIKISGRSNGGTVRVRLKDRSKEKQIIVSMLGQITVQ